MESPQQHGSSQTSDLGSRCGNSSSSLLDGYMAHSSPLDDLRLPSLKSPGSDHQPQYSALSPYSGVDLLENLAPEENLPTPIGFEHSNLSTTIYDFAAEELSAAMLVPPIAIPYAEEGNQLGVTWGLEDSNSQMVLYDSPYMETFEGGLLESFEGIGGVGTLGGGLLSTSSLPPLYDPQESVSLLLPGMQTDMFATTNNQEYSSFIPLDYSGNNINMNIPVRKQSLPAFQSETTYRATYLPHLILPMARNTGKKYLPPATPFTGLTTYQLDYTPKRVDRPIEEVVKQMTRNWDNRHRRREIFDATTTNQESFFNFYVQKAQPCPAERALAVKERGKLKDGHFFFKQKHVNKVY